MAQTPPKTLWTPSVKTPTAFKPIFAPGPPWQYDDPTITYDSPTAMYDRLDSPNQINGLVPTKWSQNA